jgi:hypothetical protein
MAAERSVLARLKRSQTNQGGVDKTMTLAVARRVVQVSVIWLH